MRNTLANAINACWYSIYAALAMAAQGAPADSSTLKEMREILGLSSESTDDALLKDMQRYA